MQRCQPPLLVLHAVLAGKKVDASDLPPEEQPVFSIVPDKLLLPAKDAATFVIKGISIRPGAAACTAGLCHAGSMRAGATLSSRACSRTCAAPCCHHAGLIQEQLQCLVAASGGAADPGAAGGGGAKGKPVFDVALVADVATPALELSKRAIEFVYLHTHGASPQLMTETLEAK